MKNDLTRLEDALKTVLGAVPVLGVEKVSLLDALGRVLAEDIVAERDNPPWDNSAMDGFAVRHEDIKQAHAVTTPTLLKVIEDVYQWHYRSERYLRNTEPIARIGMVYSQQTAAFYGGPQARSKVEDYTLGMYQALIVAIATRHADAIDIKFLADGRPVWIALPHVAWVEYNRLTGKVITDPLAVQVAGHCLKTAIESGLDNGREMYTMTVDEVLEHAEAIVREAGGTMRLPTLPVCGPG